MNALTRFERLDDMFPELFRRMMRPAASGFEAPGEIRIDVSENDQGYDVRAEIPGVKKEDIHVMIDGNQVSISAETKREKEEKSPKGDRTLVRELYHGSSSRSFTLASAVDDKAAVAKYEDGVLKLSLPSARTQQARSCRSSNRRGALGPEVLRTADVP
jgi:HSP20 family protein